MTDLLDLTESAMATHRVVRLVVDDVLTRTPRRRWIRWRYRRADPNGPDLPGLDHDWEDHVAHDDDAPKLAYLVTCPWCVGVYAALGVALADRYRPPGWRLLRRLLALSSAAGVIHGHELP